MVRYAHIETEKSPYGGDGGHGKYKTGRPYKDRAFTDRESNDRVGSDDIAH
jgi:hypothetical protein